MLGDISCIGYPENPRVNKSDDDNHDGSGDEGKGGEGGKDGPDVHALKTW